MRQGRPAVDRGLLRRLASNTAVTFAGTLALRAIGFVTTLVIVRGLGGEAYGLYSYVLSYLFFFGFLSDLGMERVVTRELARTPHRAGELIGNALVVKLVLSVVALGAAVGVAFAIEVPSATRYCIFVAGLGLPFSIELVFRSYFQSRYQMKYAFAMTVPSSLAFLAVAIAAAHWQLPVYVLFYGSVGIGAVMLVGLLLAVGRRLRLSFRPRWADVVALGRDAAEVGLFILLFMAAARIDQVMLFHLRSASDVGLYAATVRVIEAFAMVPEVLLVTVFPLLASTESTAPDVFHHTYRLTVKYLVALGLAIALMLVVLRREVMVTVFGPPFAEAAAALGVLAWFLFFSFWGAGFLGLVIAKAFQRLLVGVSALTVAVNIAGNLAWIPAHGPAGAAAATVLSNVAGFVCWYALPMTRPYMVVCLREIWRPALAALGAAGLALLPLKPAVLALAMLAAYAALLLVLGGVGFADLALARRVFAESGSGDHRG